MQKCEIRRKKNVSSDPGRAHRNHPIEQCKRASLIAQRSKNLGFTRQPRQHRSNALRILTATGFRVCSADHLGAGFHKMGRPNWLQDTNGFFILSLVLKIL